MNCLRLSFEDDANGIESMPIRNKNLTRSRGSWALMVECGSKNGERIGVFGGFVCVGGEEGDWLSSVRSMSISRLPCFIENI